MPYNILQAFSSTGLHAERKHIMRCVATEGRGNRGFLSSLAASPHLVRPQRRPVFDPSLWVEVTEGFIQYAGRL